MKHILLFGAGKSATTLIGYLVSNAKKENWKVTVIDADLEMARKKTGDSTSATVLSFDINDTKETGKHVATADIIISLLPPALHLVVAKCCIEQKKHLLTASYVDQQMKELAGSIEENNLLFL